MAERKRRATTDAEGSGGTTSSRVAGSAAHQDDDQRVPVFEKVAAPIITITSREFLVEWRTRRRKYEKLMIRHGNQRDMYSVKESFDFDVLDSLLQYEIGMTYDDCTDEHLIMWINAKINSSTEGGHASVIKRAFTGLRMDVSERDPETRVLKLFRAYDVAEEQHGLQQYFNMNPKERTKIICEALEPEGLRFRVIDATKAEMPEAKRDRRALYQLVKAKTLLFNEVFLATAAAKDAQREAWRRPNPAAKQAGGTSATKPANGDRPPPGSTARPPAGQTPSPPPSNEAPPRDGCLKCKGGHWLKDCPTASADEKVSLRRRNRHVASANTDSSAVAPQWDIVFECGVTIPGRADSGADITIIPASLVSKLDRAGQPVTAEEVPAMRVRLGNGSNTWAIITRKVTMALTLLTPVGPVTFPRTDCYVMEEGAWTILLGEPVLKAIGIDVNEQLLSVARLQNSNLDDEAPLSNIDDMGLDEDDDVTVERNIVALIEDARASGMTECNVVQMERIARLYAYALREKIGAREPADIPPYEPKLKPGVKPYRCSPRRFTPLTAAWIDKYIAELLRTGKVYLNPTSRWCSALHPVAKGQGDFRATCDLVQVNLRTEPIAGAMPVLAERVAHTMKGKRFFATFDFLKGFWQLLVVRWMQEIYSFRGADGRVYTPTRLPQGATDSALYFQAMMEEVFRELLDEGVMLLWIDDVLLCAETEDQLVSVVERFLKIVFDRRLVLNPKKSCLFQTSARWCGRVYSGDGVTEDPERVQALCDMPAPQTARDLQQFVCAAGWMRMSLPDFARSIAPLQERLTSSLEGTKKSRQAAGKVALTLTPDELASFETVKELLRHAVTLDHPAPTDDVCLFTDASARGWAICITAVDEWVETKAVADQRHRPLLFLSGTFHGSQVHWSIIEKEAFPIIFAVERAAYLLVRAGGFKLFCDHRNLVYVFAQRADRKNVQEKLYRWGQKLLPLRYQVFHIPGEENVWADILSRWGCAATTDSMERSVSVSSVSALDPLSAEDFVWPTEATLKSAQQTSTCSPPSDARVVDGLLCVDARVWIPPDARDILQRLLVIAHAGPEGHRGVEVTTTKLKNKFIIRDVKRLVHQFCSSCLLCLQVKGGSTVPRPYGPTMHPQERNATLCIDYMHLGESKTADTYACVSKDHATHMVLITACPAPTADGCARHLLQWESIFGMPRVLMSDQGSHFTADVMAELCRLKNTKQELTVAYSPWTNGTIERANKDLREVITILLHEFGIDREYWVDLLPLVQSVLNHSPTPSLAGLSPCEVMTGLPRRDALDGVFLKNHKRWLSVDWTKENVRASVERLRQSLMDIHTVIATKATRQKTKNSARQRGLQQANFAPGDFVLWSKVDRERFRDKLTVTWCGPYRVTQVLQFSVIVEDLRDGSTVEVHASRLRFYTDKALATSERLQQHLERQALVGVEALCAHKPSERHGYVMEVKWRGLEAEENTWEPIRRIAKDVPAMLGVYVEASRDRKLKAFHGQRGLERQ